MRRSMPSRPLATTPIPRSGGGSRSPSADRGARSAHEPDRRAGAHRRTAPDTPSVRTSRGPGPGPVVAGDRVAFVAACRYDDPQVVFATVEGVTVEVAG